MDLRQGTFAEWHIMIGLRKEHHYSQLYYSMAIPI